MATDGHSRLYALLLGFLVCGCSRKAPVPFEEFASPPIAYHARSPSQNAFDGYVLIAEDVEGVTSKYSKRVSFSLPQRREIQRLLSPFVTRLRSESAKSCEFVFSPHSPLQPAPYDRGWRLLGMCLYWNIQDEIAANQFDAAIADALLATRFGFDVSGGGAVEASTGFAAVADARRALIPALPQLTASQLQVLEDGLKTQLSRKPLVSLPIGHERANALLAVQTLQDAHRENALNLFEVAYGDGADETLKYLKALDPLDPKRATFFRSLAEYAKAENEFALRLAAVPALGRYAIKPPPLPPNHIWRRIAKYIVNAPFPLIEMNDVAIARTRLLIIEVEFARRRKLQLGLPKDLRGFPPAVATDPFSGSRFVYRKNGDDYLVYSVGKNGVDDLGATDADRLSPDLFLESD